MGKIKFKLPPFAVRKTLSVGDEVEDVREMVASRCGEDHVFFAFFFFSFQLVGSFELPYFFWFKLRSFWICNFLQQFLMDFFGMLIVKFHFKNKLVNFRGRLPQKSDAPRRD